MYYRNNEQFVMNNIYIYIYIYIYLCCQSQRVTKTLMQIHFCATNLINVRLTQRVFCAWPVVQHIAGEMEMHSVANLATLQTPNLI